jgi:RsiW-degrading membrane proteinase PrsW (M82 family)
MIPLKVIVLAAAIGVLPVAAWLWIIVQYNRYHRQGESFLMRVFFWGVLAAIPASVIEIVLIETDSNNMIIQAMETMWSYQSMASLAPALISAGLIALIEEFSKGIGVVVSVFSNKLKIYNDGLMFGILIGLAFAVTENGVYFANALNSRTIAEVWPIVVLRFLLSTSAHVIYTGLMGKYLADGLIGRNYFAYLKAIFIPVGVHLGFNYLLGTQASWLVVVIIFAGMYLLWYYYHLNKWEKEKALQPL